jgi:DNA-binding winged helix-turn-helix (wHTH) protein/TolB-like protein
VAYQFGTWIVEPHLNRIRNSEGETQLEPKTAEVLAYLLSHEGQIVSIDELLDNVWKDRVVEANAVHRNVNRIRRALGDTAREREYIETIPKRGYRTIAPVEEIESSAPSRHLAASLAAITPPYPAYDGDEPFTFICYSHTDREVVYRELLRLREAGVNVWYDEGISPGSEWEDEIANAIGQCEHFLFFVSPHSVTSRHCLDEVQYAQRVNRNMVIVHLEPTTLSDGLQLSIGRLQALFKYVMREREYARKLIGTLNAQAPKSTEGLAEPVVAPRLDRKRRNYLIGGTVAAAVLLVLVLLSPLDLGRLFSRIPPNSIAVGQFEDLSPSYDQRWITGSIVSDVRVELPKRGLQVVGSDYLRRTDGTASVPNAQYLVQGSVLRLRNMIRVTAVLISLDNEHQLWAEVFEKRVSEDETDMRDITTAIVAAVAQRIQGTAEAVPTLINVDTSGAESGVLQSIPTEESGFGGFGGFEEESNE